MTLFDINEFVGAGAISNNAAGFSRSLMGLMDYVDGSVGKVIRKASIDLYRDIVEQTPVDTGRAKANWALSTVEANPDIRDKDGYSANELAVIISGEISDFKFDITDGVVWITNNLEYIEQLEDGTSEQAPYGMVSVSLARFEAHFNDALIGLKGLSKT